VLLEDGLMWEIGGQHNERRWWGLDWRGRWLDGGKLRPAWGLEAFPGSSACTV
jgi:hypothetical protein